MRRYREELRTINAFLASRAITLDCRPLAAFTLTRRFILKAPSDAPRFDLHGRLYGGPWQNLKSARRLFLRIDGERLAYLDYSAMHPRLAYARLGIELAPEDDPYADIEGLTREEAKAGLNAVISHPAGLHMRGLRGELRKEFHEGWTAKRLADAIAARHPMLVPLLEQGDLGLELMFLDSTILIAVLLRLANEFTIAALPMHDGLMVPEPDAGLAKGIMEEEAKRLAGVEGAGY